DRPDPHTFPTRRSSDLFGDLTPRGHSPVNIGGVFYNVADAVQPDPEQTIRLAVYGQDARGIKDEPSVALVAGPVLDGNGNPVPVARTSTRLNSSDVAHP